MLDPMTTSETNASAIFGASVAPVLEHADFSRERRLPVPQRHTVPTEPAISVMTDFTRAPPFAVPAERSIDDALGKMIVAGVRALFVVRNDAVVGLITSYDIEGERPLEFLATSGPPEHDEIEVAHIMTPWHDVPRVDMRWVSLAQVADVDQWLKHSNASHIVVTERGAGGMEIVRGLFSRSRLERQLGRVSV